MGQLYDYWQQNDFPYHGIQTLDFAQWPRIPLLDATYMKKFALKGEDVDQCDLWPSERLWELSNTRYILKSASLVPLLSKQADARHSFHVKTFLKVVPKPGVTAIEDAGDLTAVPDGRGAFALIEFTNAFASGQTLFSLAVTDKRRRHSGNPGLSRVRSRTNRSGCPGHACRPAAGRFEARSGRREHHRLSPQARQIAGQRVNACRLAAQRPDYSGVESVGRSKAGAASPLQLSYARRLPDARRAYSRVSISTAFDHAVRKSLRLGSRNSNRGVSHLFTNIRSEARAGARSAVNSKSAGEVISGALAGNSGWCQTKAQKARAA